MLCVFLSGILMHLTTRSAVKGVAFATDLEVVVPDATEGRTTVFAAEHTRLAKHVLVCRYCGRLHRSSIVASPRRSMVALSFKSDQS